MEVPAGGAHPAHDPGRAAAAALVPVLAPFVPYPLLEIAQRRLVLLSGAPDAGGIEVRPTARLPCLTEQDALGRISPAHLPPPPGVVADAPSVSAAAAEHGVELEGVRGYPGDTHGYHLAVHPEERPRRVVQVQVRRVAPPDWVRPAGRDPRHGRACGDRETTRWGRQQPVLRG